MSKSEKKPNEIFQFERIKFGENDIEVAKFQIEIALHSGPDRVDF